MDTIIKVVIHNWNCLANDKQMVLSVNSSNMLVLSEAVSPPRPEQQWIMVPNLVTGAAGGGYTLLNAARQLAAEQPVVENQISLGDDPTPYGSKVYCWTLWPAGTGNNEGLWAIQSYNRGPAMDADGGGCDIGTRVLLWRWKSGNNQRWVIRKT